MSFHDILSAAVVEYDHLQDYASRLSKENFILRQKLVLARKTSRDRPSPRKSHFSVHTSSADSGATESCSSQMPSTRKAFSSTSTSAPPLKTLSNLMCSLSSAPALTSSVGAKEAGSTATGALHFPVPACGDPDGPLRSLSRPELAYSEPETSIRWPSAVQEWATETAISQRWEVRADQGWMPFAPGVYFRGFAGEEVQYQIGSTKYKAEFYSERSGVQINLSTLKQRSLRRHEETAEQDSGVMRLDSGGSAHSNAEASVTVNRKCPRPASKTAALTTYALSQLKNGGSYSSSTDVNVFGESTTATDQITTDVVTSEETGLSVAASQRCNQSARSCAIEGGIKYWTARSEADTEAVTMTTNSISDLPAHSSLRTHWNAPVMCTLVGDTNVNGGCSTLEGDCGGHHMDVRGFLPRALAATTVAPALEEALQRRESRRRTQSTDSWSDWDNPSDHPSGESWDWNLNMPGHMLKGITTERSEPIVTPRPPEKPSHHMVPHSPRFLPTPREPSSGTWGGDEELNAAVSVS